MSRLVIAAVIVGAFSLTVSAQKKDSDDLNNLTKETYAAWNTLNPDNPAPVYAKDADLIFFDIAPLKYTSWKDYSENFKKTVGPSFTSLKITPNGDIKTKIIGNMALTTLTFQLSAKQKDGTAMEFVGRHTIVWEKRSGKWLIIHEHLSKALF